ncbi:HAMP domain-containing sensor histidine kinase [Miltoncostaea marina]|uniref:HAMP domain-containing sensor histidine kinase n=1 Tax=Miltoncostaea marina TaxID=2843215 RepID=UPI001C3DE4FC|nr:HAMP domain-containing sensor histidine kinase [Miltoncostaea marina]
MSAPGPPRSRRALRTRLLVTVVVAVGVALALLVAAFNVALGRGLANDADEVVQARAQGELAGLVIEDGHISVPDGPVAPDIDTRVWIFEGRRAIAAPVGDAGLGNEAIAMAGGPERSHEVDGDALLHALPVTAGGRRIGTVVAGISLAPYNRTRVIALIGSVALALVVLSAVALASAVILRAALRPVARMTADASAWSESDLDKRFAVGPPHDEITRLAATLDGLLDRLAAGMRRERRLTAEVSHELRTPLAQIGAEIDLALRRDREPAEYRAALERVRAGAQRIEATIETLMATARHETSGPRGTGDPALAAGRVVEACAPLAGVRGVDLAIDDVPDGPRAGVEEPVLERILAPVVENACRHAARRVRVLVRREGRDVLVEVRDDGPGVPEDERELIFEPGVRGSTAPADGDGAGLGLSLARRLARAAGGDVQAADGGDGGRFVVRLPSA